MKQNQADKKSFHWKQGIWVVVWMIGLGILGGCNKQASLEDRTYVESLHVTPVEDAYQYQCILAYVNQDSMDQLKAGVSGTDQSQEGSDSSEDKQGMEGAVMMAGCGRYSIFQSGLLSFDRKPVGLLPFRGDLSGSCLISTDVSGRRLRGYMG